MLNRRTLIAAGAALVGATLATGAFAQDWKAKYPELVLGVIPAENGSGVLDRYGPFVEYLSKEIGVKVTLRVAQDYAAVIEGQRAGNIHIAYYGPASFARARLTGVATDVFAMDVNNDGAKGYYSVFYVKASSPYKTLQDLKGKNLGLVDPNSTSGNNMPRFELDKMKIEPEKFFDKVVFTGSHENAVLALSQGTVDVAANAWTADDDSYLYRMITKNMLKNADGSPAKVSDYRIIHKSTMIVNGPYAFLSSLPDDLKAKIRDAFMNAATKDKAAFDKLSDGKNKPWAATENKDYDQTIELIRFVDSLRKKSS